MENPYIKQLTEQHDALRADSDALLQRAASEQREVTDAEYDSIQDMYRSMDKIRVKLAPIQEEEQRRSAFDTERAKVEQVRQATRNVPPSHGQLERYRGNVGEYLADWGNQRRDPAAHDRVNRANAEWRVVADQKLADNPGIVPIPIVGGVIDTINAARPFLNSVTNYPMPAGGSTFNRPKITQHTLVGVQATEKTQLASQKMTIASVPVTKKTYGGTLDISFQDRDWTDPAILAIAVSDLANVYARETDNNGADSLVAAATQTFVLGASPASGAVRAAVLNAANQIAVNVGVYPDTVWMAPDVAAQLGAIVETGSGGLPSFPGLSQVGSTGELMGLRSVVDVNFAAGTMLIGSSTFVEHYETVGGLLSVTEPTILGYTIAYYGYVADLLLDTGAVLKRSLT